MKYFAHKLKLLKNQAGAALCRTIEAAVKKSLSSHFGREQGDLFQKTLSFEITYALVRHRYWHNHTLLVDLLSHFIRAEFYLPDAFSQNLARTALDIYQAESQKDLGVFSDQSLFAYALFNTILYSRDEESLIADLGLGKTLVEELKGLISAKVTTISSSLGAATLGTLAQAWESFILVSQERPEELLQLRLCEELGPRADADYQLGLEILKALQKNPGLSTQGLEQGLPAPELRAQINLLLDAGLIYALPKSSKSRAKAHFLARPGIEFMG